MRRNRSAVERNYSLNPSNVKSKGKRQDSAKPEPHELPRLSDKGSVYTFVISEKRYKLWQNAVKARYWLDIPFVDNMCVNWVDAKDSVNCMVEHMVKVSEGEDPSSAKSLYTITLYNTKKKIMIQGPMRDHWINDEFPILQKLVSLLDEGKPARDAYFECTGKSLDINDGRDLDISVEEFAPSNQATTKSECSEFTMDSGSLIADEFLVSKSSEDKFDEAAVSDSPIAGFMNELVDLVVAQVQEAAIQHRVDQVYAFETEAPIPSISSIKIDNKSDSDVEQIQLQAQCSTPKPKVHSRSKKSHRKHSPAAKQTSPIKRHSQLKSLQSEEVTVALISDKYGATYNNLIERLTKLENTVASLEYQLAEKDHEILELHDQLDKLQSIQSDFCDAKVAVKHEMSVIRRETQQKLESHTDRVSKVESNGQKLLSKINSLHDQQTTTNQKVKMIESTCKPEDESIQSIQSSLKECQSTLDQMLHNEDLLTDKLTSLESRLDSERLNQNPRMSSIKSSVPRRHPSNPSPTNYRRPSSIIPPHPDMVLLMDSNRRFIEPQGLAPRNKSVQIVQCGDLTRAKSIISNENNPEPEVIALHVGINDLESNSVQDVCSSFKDTVSMTTARFPNARVVVSQVTPRSDNFCNAVNEVNQYLSNHLLQNLPPNSKVSVLQHDNITADHLHDRKHLSRRKGGVSRLAGNLKKAFVQAVTPTMSPPEGGTGESGNTSSNDNTMLMSELLSQLKSVSSVMMSGFIGQTVRPPYPSPVRPVFNPSWPSPPFMYQPRPPPVGSRSVVPSC